MSKIILTKQLKIIIITNADECSGEASLPQDHQRAAQLRCQVFLNNPQFCERLLIICIIRFTITICFLDIIISCALDIIIIAITTTVTISLRSVSLPLPSFPRKIFFQNLSSSLVEYYLC